MCCVAWGQQRSITMLEWWHQIFSAWLLPLKLLRSLSQNEKVTKHHEVSSTSSSQTSFHSNPRVPRRGFGSQEKGAKKQGPSGRLMQSKYPSSVPCGKSSATRRCWEPTDIDEVLYSTSRKPGFTIEWRITHVGSVQPGEINVFDHIGGAKIEEMKYTLKMGGPCPSALLQVVWNIHSSGEMDAHLGLSSPWVRDPKSL